MTKIELKRGDVVLIAFPFVAGGAVQRKRRPAVVVQSNRYNRQRDAVIIAAVTSSTAWKNLPCKVLVTKKSVAGAKAGFRLDSVIDCQTLATVPRDEIVSVMGRLPSDTMRRIDLALTDALQIEDTPARQRIRPQ